MIPKVIVKRSNLRKQLRLFEEPATGEGNGLHYGHRHVSRSTFLGGLSSRVHRWFRLTPSFGPELVSEMLEEMGHRGSAVVYDPFAGAATTLIECKLRGIPSFGTEINPVLQFVGETSLQWAVDTNELIVALEAVADDYRRLVRRLTLDNLPEHGCEVPPIHNPLRWWREDVLIGLLALKKSIDVVECSPQVRNALRLGLLSALVPDLSNVTLGRLQLHFIDRTKDVIDVFGTFARRVNVMVEDLDAVSLLDGGVPAVDTLLDATIIEAPPFGERAAYVVTSPPYPNRYSYVWNTRPHLYFMDFLASPREASDLDKKTVGGTWGTATSVLAKGKVEPSHEAVARNVGGVVEQIRAADNLMANYVMKYFNDLASQVSAMEAVVSEEARLAYVVGCSRVKGVFVETDLLLGKIIADLGLGYKVVSTHRFRRRHSGKGLHETIVYAAR